MRIAESAAPKRPGDRLRSLDAYRGFVMLVLVAGPVVGGVAGAHAEYAPLALLARQLDHVPWQGCSLWDLVMPAFMLMVGVSLPFSVASRRARGDAPAAILRHALYRSAVFVLLGLLISSRDLSYTRFEFTGLLTQFGLAYPFAYLLVGRSRTVQLATLGGILTAYGLAFALVPAPPPGFDYTPAGLPEDVEPFSGWFAHWNRGTNLAVAFDQWFLNLFPRPEPFRFDPLGNQTLNFVPGIATMTLGVMTGEFLRGPRSGLEKLRALLAAGAALLVAGTVIGWTLCPIVKALWTPSYVLFAGGWTLLGLAGFLWLVDLRGRTGWVFPFTVVGMNSLAMYVMDSLARPWLSEQIRIHIVASSWTLRGVLVVLALWSICLWMYRRSIFLRV